MKKILFFLMFFVSLQWTLSAQTTPPKSGLGFGMQINQYQKDFGVGLQLTSPFFANQKVAFRIRGNFMFHEHLMSEEYTWTPYGNTTIGVVVMALNKHPHLRLYSEGGMIALFPNADFSAETFQTGGYGLFGFEFLAHPNWGYFFEAGGVGTGAKADRLPSSPIYSNGFILSVGMRGRL